MKKLLKDAVQIIRENWQVYFAINILFYGTVIIGMIIISSNPQLHKIILRNLNDSLRNGNGLLSFVAKYYIEKNIPIAITLTFLGNLFLATFIHITLPSLIIPFAGFLIFIYRAFLWGIIFGFDFPVEFYGVAILEGQGYIIGALAVYLYSMYVLRPNHYGFQKRKEAFLYGIKLISKLYILVAIVLLVAAVYEVFIVTSYTSFPPHKYSKEKINLTGSEVKLMSSGCSVYYDSASVTKNDAKVVGFLLEEIGYLKKGDYDVVKICKNTSIVYVKLYLEEKYWNDKTIIKRFELMKKSFSKMFPNREIEIIAFYSNVSGIKKEKVL